MFLIGGDNVVLKGFLTPTAQEIETSELQKIGQFTEENRARTMWASKLKLKIPHDSYGDRVQPVDYRHHECLFPSVGLWVPGVIICRVYYGGPVKGPGHYV